MSRLNCKTYYKVILADLTQEWLDHSQVDSIKTLIKSKANFFGLGATYTILTFCNKDVPVSLFNSHGEGMNHKQVMVELQNNLWIID